MYIHHVFPIALFQDTQCFLSHIHTVYTMSFLLHWLQDTQCFIKILWVLFLLANSRARVKESLDCIWSFPDFLQKLSKLFTLWDCPSSANKKMCHAVNISMHCTSPALRELEELNICRQDNHQSFAQKLSLPCKCACMNYSYTFHLHLHFITWIALNKRRPEYMQTRRTIICLLPKNSLSHVYMDHSYTFLLEAFLCITLNNICRQVLHLKQLPHDLESEIWDVVSSVTWDLGSFFMKLSFRNLWWMNVPTWTIVDTAKYMQTSQSLVLHSTAHSLSSAIFLQTRFFS